MLTNIMATHRFSVVPIQRLVACAIALACEPLAFHWCMHEQYDHVPLLTTCSLIKLQKLRPSPGNEPRDQP